MGVLQEIVVGVGVLAAFLGLVAGLVFLLLRHFRRQSLSQVIKKHFQPTRLEQIMVTERQFPFHIRADLQPAIDEFVKQATLRVFTGVQGDSRFGEMDFASLLDVRLFSESSRAAPPQYEQMDIGEDEPTRTLACGLWLLERKGTKFGVLQAPVTDFGSCGARRRVRVQVAAADEEAGRRAASEFFQHLESAVLNARSYRGKILSLEQEEGSYSGQSSGVKVHRLGKVAREEIILPRTTLELLERNVLDFVRRRSGLGELQMTTKKGLLFYGPPGNGKTHTIRYLAGSLEGHTTLLISAEQVAMLGEYMTLARLLQPSLVVIEDVDLIARERTRMRYPGSELLLNKLLNEMDGLKEDCEVLFILTTNRPQQLEAALAARPGRIDQAIEFPLPDAEGRMKLVRLYARGLTVPDEVAEDMVKRTRNVSASFIKELMRRSAQFHLQRSDSRTLESDDVSLALDEMLFRGGSLNLKLLGGEQWSGEQEETP